MNKITAGLIAAGFIGTAGLVLASGSHSHRHDTSSASAPRTNTEKTGHGESGRSGHGEKGGHGGKKGHQHGSWGKPPAAYASLINKDWDDSAAALRGNQLYTQQCAYCHGADGKGKGKGPAAAGFEHPPADLTNHFHQSPGNGDGYLYWRISEGGTAEPFRSMKSVMPAFKNQLSEQDRWAILTYVHQEFHGGFPSATEISGSKKKPPYGHDSESAKPSTQKHHHSNSSHH